MLKRTSATAGWSGFLSGCHLSANFLYLFSHVKEISKKYVRSYHTPDMQSECRLTLLKCLNGRRRVTRRAPHNGLLASF